MIDIIIDGIWCNECKTLHPTLMWHKKYGKEETNDGIAESIRKLAEARPRLCGLNENMSADDKESVLNEIIKKNLKMKRVIEAVSGECIVCGAPTEFVSKKTGHHVCSDECLYRENGWIDEETGEVIPHYLDMY